MDNLHVMVQNQLKYIETRIDKIEKYLSAAPDGKLYCSVSGKYRDYRYGIKEGEHITVHCIRKNDPLIEALFNKRYYLLYNETLKKNEKACKRFLSSYRSDISESIHKNLKYWEQPLFEKYFYTDADKIKAWQNEPYNQNPYKPEERCIATLSGDFVRSKSEREIANALYRNGIPFRTDCEFRYNDGVIYTDFVILHPKTMELYYWEHYGMLDDPRYNSKNSNRIAVYASQKIMIGDKLIITGETSNCVLNTKTIEEIITKFFM